MKKQDQEIIVEALICQVRCREKQIIKGEERNERLFEEYSLIVRAVASVDESCVDLVVRKLAETDSKEARDTMEFLRDVASEKGTWLDSNDFALPLPR